MPLSVHDPLVLDEVATRGAFGTGFRTSTSIDGELDIEGVPVELSWLVAFDWKTDATPPGTATLTAAVEVMDPDGVLVAAGSRRFPTGAGAGHVEVPVAPFVASSTGDYTVRLTVEGVEPIDLPISLVVTA